MFLGKLGIYDADGDGDFDVEDAKVLLGKCKWRGNNLCNSPVFKNVGFLFYIKIFLGLSYLENLNWSDGGGVFSWCKLQSCVVNLW